MYKINKGFFLNIYIYGGNSYKKEILKVLSRGSIQDKLDEIAKLNDNSGKVIIVEKVDELKNIIADDDDNIFLIDDQKIITDDIFSKILKFLNPKDGINKKYLEKHNTTIELKSSDAMSIVKYILDRLELYNAKEITRIEEMREEDLLEALSL
jgi:hypothetical protein